MTIKNLKSKMTDLESIMFASNTADSGYIIACKDG